MNHLSTIRAFVIQLKEALSFSVRYTVLQYHDLSSSVPPVFIILSYTHYLRILKKSISKLLNNLNNPIIPSSDILQFKI